MKKANVSVCFLFAQHFDDDSGLCLKLNAQGQIETPLARRTIEEIRALQFNSRTLVILPAEVTSMHEVELPWLGERKTRAALPYALEEHVAQNIATLQFAFDRKFYQNDRYLVVAIDKLEVQNLVERLEKLHIVYEGITLDWFALHSGEVCLGESNLLIHTPTFRGTLSLELVPLYFKEELPDVHRLAFVDSAQINLSDSFERIDCDSKVWIARRLLQQPWINLCQGAMTSVGTRPVYNFWYAWSVLFISLGLLSIVGFKLLSLSLLKTQINSIDTKIASIYHEFFPKAQRVISPKFQITQLLNQSQFGQGKALWQVWEQVAFVFKQYPFEMQQMRFQNQAWTIQFTCHDFTVLDQIETALQQKNIKVQQIAAIREAEHVKATLELHL